MTYQLHAPPLGRNPRLNRWGLWGGGLDAVPLLRAVHNHSVRILKRKHLPLAPVHHFIKISIPLLVARCFQLC